MAIYQVLRRCKEDNGDVLFIKDGFSLPAFVFGPLWAARHGMWVAASLILFALVASSLFAGRFGEGANLAAALSMAVSLLFGLEACDLRVKALAKRGYVLVALVEARNLEDAELRYFTTHGGGTGPKADSFEMPRALPRSSDALGLFR